MLALMFSSLRIVVAGAEKLSPAVRDAFKLKFNKDIFEGYGATETTPVASVNVPDELDVNNWKVQRGAKIGTVGMPLPGTSFRIVDPNTLATLPPNEDGLILIGGNQVMLGYLDDPERTAAAVVTLDGMRWYKTGDKGHIDEDGFLSIVDRYSRFDHSHVRGVRGGPPQQPAGLEAGDELDALRSQAAARVRRVDGR